MTDLKDEIGRAVQRAMATVGPSYNEPAIRDAPKTTAQAIIDLIIARIPPLVWSEPSEDPYQHQMSGPYEVTDAGHLYFHEIERGDISTNLIARFDTLEAAKAAANAHHVAQLCKGMGIE